jgi:hypothetical protein
VAIAGTATRVSSRERKALLSIVGEPFFDLNSGTQEAVGKNQVILAR